MSCNRQDCTKSGPKYISAITTLAKPSSRTEFRQCLLMAVIALSILWVTSGCLKETPCTIPGAARCSGEKLQICTGDKKWVDNIDCADVSKKVGIPLVCGMDEKNKRNSCVEKKTK